MSIYVFKKESIFTVDLKSNPTTGYRWRIIRYDKAILKLIKRSYVSPKTHLIGSGGIESFKFQSLKSPIDTVIKFKYARPWEKSEGIYQEVHVISK
jgi:inhibitor of cysteine peptidase